jgi:hypothetical protein
VVDGVYRLHEGALLDDIFQFLRELGVLELMGDVQSTALQCEMVPVVQYLLLYGLKTVFGIERMNTLSALLFSDEALTPLVGFNAQQVRHGVCQRWRHQFLEQSRDKIIVSAQRCYSIVHIANSPCW